MYETEIATPVNELADRTRTHVGPGIRSLDQQKLDALLRIEELMNSQLNGLRHLATLLSPQKDIQADQVQKGRGRR